MYYAKIMIPRMSESYKIYVFRSRFSEDINSITKIKDMSPVFMIDESIAKGIPINGKEMYVLYDKQQGHGKGITYYGPPPSIIPVTEYETNIEIAKINTYTYVNVLKLNPLPVKHRGVMYYYSAIGVDENNQFITHLSKIVGVLLTCPYDINGTRHIYSCNDYKDNEENKWTYDSSVSWREEIRIGDINNSYELERFGIPVVETVPSLKKEEITASIREVPTRNFLTLEIPNPWMKNNREYNFRKLKSFKIRNVAEEQYSGFSEPTFQSVLPVSIEKLLILCKIDAENPEEIIQIGEPITESVKHYEIIRKDGIYYNRLEHKKLGLNKFCIPRNEDVAIFSESSVQEKIKTQIEALPAHIYSFSFYLIDVYGKLSEPTHYVIRT